MNTTVADFAWVGRHPAFCLTVSRARSPHEVLAAYGAEPATARMLTAAEAAHSGHSTLDGTLLRAGTLGDRGFCCEDGEAEGSKEAVLDRLSAQTETFACFHGGDGTNFSKHLRDRNTVENFEPGMAPTGRGQGPFSRAVDVRISHESRCAVIGVA